MKPTLCVVFAALPLLVLPATGATLNIADGEVVEDDQYSQLRASNGFVWDHHRDFASGDVRCGGGDSLLLSGGFTYSPECWNPYTISRTDETRFDVESFRVDALDYSNIAGEGPEPVHPDYLDFDYDDFETDEAYDAAVDAVWDRYDEWLFEGNDAPLEDRFLAIGLRDGVEVARHTYGPTDGQEVISLSGFNDLDALAFTFFYPDGADVNAWDYEIPPNLFPGARHCYAACEWIYIYGFEYALVDGDGSALPIAPVPLPAGLPLLAGGLALLGLFRRRLR